MECPYLSCKSVPACRFFSFNTSVSNSNLCNKVFCMFSYMETGRSVTNLGNLSELLNIRKLYIQQMGKNRSLKTLVWSSLETTEVNERS